MQHAITQRKERLTGVADGAKGLPRPVGHRSRVAARAGGLAELVRVLANAAVLAPSRLVRGASGHSFAAALAGGTLNALILSIDALGSRVGGEGAGNAGSRLGVPLSLVLVAKGARRTGTAAGLIGLGKVPWVAVAFCRGSRERRGRGSAKPSVKEKN